MTYQNYEILRLPKDYVCRCDDKPIVVVPPVLNPPVASFTASSTSITVGQSITFTDTSTNSPTSWSWTFSGGTPATSSLQSRSVTFNTVGTHTVTLTATNADGSDTETKTNYITVAASSVAAIPVQEQPTATAPTTLGIYTPTSAADMENVSNANKIAIISNTFDGTGVTIASGQIIRPAGGAITGIGININDAFIEENNLSAFNESSILSNVYDKSKLRPETFGAIANDANDDIDAIYALIKNSKFAMVTTNATYIANKDMRSYFNPIERTGSFIWDLATSKIETTDNSTFHHAQQPLGTGTQAEINYALSHQGYYILALKGFDKVDFRNFEFDGNDLASRFLNIEDCDTFYYDNFNVHNLLGPTDSYARTVAFDFHLRPEVGGFTEGYATNGTITNVDAPGDGVSNNSQGIAKAMNFSIKDIGAADIYINNNTITDITGDDAEGIYTRGDDNYSNVTAELYFHIKANDFYRNSRRAIKFDCSNAFIEDNYIETSTLGLANQQAALIQTFSINAGVPVKNVSIKRNEVRILGDSFNTFFGTNDSRDVTVEDNIFWAEKFTVFRSLSFSNPTGQQDSLYDGDLSNLIFRNNVITNGFIDIFDKYYVLPGLNEPVFEDNIQNFTGSVSLGAFRAAINIGGSTLSGTMKNTHDFRIKDHTINYDLSTMSTGTFLGVLSSNGVKPKRMKLENVNINYTGSGSVGAIFAGVRSGSTVDLDSTNEILNCTITGASGTNAIEFNGGDTSVIITNSVGDGSTPITVQ